jgi:uncharacterized membrane protein
VYSPHRSPRCRIIGYPKCRAGRAIENVGAVTASWRAGDEEKEIMKGRTLRFFEVLGWVTIVLMSVIGVAGSVTHLLDSGIRIGDAEQFRQTTENIYGSDFTPHWYNFRKAPLVRVAHMAPGFLWMVFAPLQFVGAIRRAAPRFHRWVGRVALAMTVILIPSGLAFAALHPFSSAFEELAPICFYTLIYLFAVVLGVKTARQKNYVAHREWMIRAFSIGIGISSVRVWFVLFMHTTGMQAQKFFATAFWIAFGMNLLIAEIWINVTRKSAVPRKADLPRAAERSLEAAPGVDWVPGAGE